MLDMTKPAALQQMFAMQVDALSNAMKEDLRSVRDSMDHISSIYSVVLDGLPEISSSSNGEGAPKPWKQARLEFQNCNPFPLVRYVTEAISNDSGSSNVARKPMTMAERKKLKEIFKKHDKDNSGNLDLKEVEMMITELGGKISPEQLEAAVRQLDKNDNGTCDLDEFISWWTATPGCGGYSLDCFGSVKVASG
jgi:hypothetical protein